MEEILKNGFEKLNISLGESQTESLKTYAKLLKEWNEKINLTGIIDDEGIAIKHFVDSASPLSLGKVGKKVIDVGTGAGFPGLVMKIIAPELDVTLLDSLNKRLVFLEDVINQTKLENVHLIHSRAEDGAHKAELRESFDTAVSRAVASLPLLCELCLGYVKPGGYFLALKGPSAEEEVKSAERAITILGGELESIEDIPIENTAHKIIVIKKVRHTPMKFPRKPAMISKCGIESCYKTPKRPSL